MNNVADTNFHIKSVEPVVTTKAEKLSKKKHKFLKNERGGLVLPFFILLVYSFYYTGQNLSQYKANHLCNIRRKPFVIQGKTFRNKAIKLIKSKATSRLKPKAI